MNANHITQPKLTCHTWVNRIQVDRRTRIPLGGICLAADTIRRSWKTGKQKINISDSFIKFKVLPLWLKKSTIGIKGHSFPDERRVIGEWND